jgi:hypothetical protein
MISDFLKSSKKTLNRFIEGKQSLGLGMRQVENSGMVAIPEDVRQALAGDRSASGYKDPEAKGPIYNQTP